MDRNVIKDKSKDFDSLFFVRALPNEYLVQIGSKRARPVLGGKRFRLLRRFMKIPASVQVIKFSLSNHSRTYQGIQVEGYACWRIDPDRVGKAVNVLDFYNAYDPMHKPSEDLKTICTEAIRHIVANMDIEEALKNKSGIADQLKMHLTTIEEKWGILFDQVGIENIHIMSDKVFDDLQAKERDKLRLDASLSRFETDKKIDDANAVFERETHRTKLESERLKKIAAIENDSELNERELALRKQEIEMENEIEMQKLATRMKETREQKELEKGLLEKEKVALERKLAAEKQSLELMGEKRKIENNIGMELVMERLVERLPECLKALELGNVDIHLGPDQIERVVARIAAALKGNHTSGTT